MVVVGMKVLISEHLCEEWQVLVKSSELSRQEDKPCLCVPGRGSGRQTSPANVCQAVVLAGRQALPVCGRPWFCSLLGFVWSHCPVIFLLPHLKTWLSQDSNPFLSWLLFQVSHHSSHLIFIIISENHSSDHSVDKKKKPTISVRLHNLPKASRLVRK